MSACIGGCGLAAEPGDVMCQGCREGFTRAPESVLDWPRETYDDEE